MTEHGLDETAADDAAPTTAAGADVVVLGRELAYRGFFDFEVVRLRHRRFDGQMSPVIKREVLNIPEAAAVLPYDPVADRVVLIEQFRTGTLRHPEGPWLIEVAAGLVAPGESAAQTARREILEETGITPLRLEPIGVYIASPGAVTERSTVFIAEVDASRAGGVHGLAGEDEDIKSHVVDLATAFAWLESGRIVAANAVIPLRWLQVHHAALRARWLAERAASA